MTTLYDGPGTLILGGQEFAIHVTVNETQEHADVSGFGTGRRTAPGLKQWTASFWLIDPTQENALAMAQFGNADMETIRLPDGSEASAILKNGWLLGSGEWPSTP
jgi:hypothetical protein